jgi:hypothetical protein
MPGGLTRSLLTTTAAAGTATGSMTCLQIEALDAGRVVVPLVVLFVDQCWFLRAR